MRRGAGVWIVLGLLLIAAALGLSGYNLYDQHRAANCARQTCLQLCAQRPVAQASTQVTQEIEIPDYILNPQMEMPTMQIDGVDYIGTVEIPTLTLTLPVASQWSGSNARNAPCRYSGSAYTRDLILAGHNYPAHFGRLRTLQMGALVRFTDTEGHVFSYQVVTSEVLPANGGVQLAEGDWDLTLFTCTVGGRSRLVLRCEAVEAAEGEA